MNEENNESIKEKSKDGFLENSYRHTNKQNNTLEFQRTKAINEEV